MSKVSDKYIVIDNKLIFGDTEITFDFRIDDTVEISRMLIVLLSIPAGTKFNENVYAVSLTEKKIKWRIKKRIFPTEPYIELHCKYSSISIFNGKLRLNNWCDVYLIVDPLTGEVLEEHETR